MFQKLRESSLFVIIAGIILVIFLGSIFMPKKEYSENENKYLATAPPLTLESLLNGTFAMRYEDYVADHFLGRDQWITAKSVSEFALLKKENNGVVYGKDGYLFQTFYKFNQEDLMRNLDAIDKFAFNAMSDVFVMVVPSSYYPLVDYLPNGVPTVDQGYYINEIDRYLSNTTTPINVKDVLAVNANNYIFYRTDHHWTAYGAWLAYAQFTSAHGLSTFNYKISTPVQVPGFLGTSYSKCKVFNVQPDILEYFDLPGSVTVGDKTYDSLYDYDQLQKRDKYAALLHGNNAYCVVESEYRPDKLDSILVIRDSYADSFVPYLTTNYNKIVLVDPRYYTGSFLELANTRFDDILILFGFENYCVEKSIAKLGLDD